MHTYGINYQERAWKQNILNVYLKAKEQGEKRRQGMLLKKHDERDGVGASRKW